MKLDDKILIVGARGMVGSALSRLLQKQGYHNLLLPSHLQLDATCQQAVRSYMQKEKPDVVVIACAKVGGILANQTYPVEFLYDNVMMATNLIHEAHHADVNRLLFLGSSCIYPKFAPQPIFEEALLSSALEPTNEAYAIAKIVGLKLCQYYQSQYGRQYISAMPTNLYGPGDTYHNENSHVIPGLMLRMHRAKLEKKPEVAIWGKGTALREFLYVEDLASALLFLLNHYYEQMHINVGSGEEVSIKDLAHIISETIGYQGAIVLDSSKPDGTPRKKIDITKMTSLGWRSQTSLKEGLKIAYQDYLNRLNY